MLHCTWLVCWIANHTRLFHANCFPTDRVISNWNRCSHLHWPIYLSHWNRDQKTEIRSYVKCRSRLNIDSKQIFNELCDIYGPQTISVSTVFRWAKAFKAGKFSVEDDTCPGRPKTSVTKTNIAAVKILVEQDVQLSVRDIASCTGISEGSVQTILKKHIWTWERFALGGYLICSLRSKRHNALNVPENIWKHTNAVIVGLFLTCLQVMKPGCTCLSHKEGLIISNGSEKIKNTHVLPREPLYCQENHKFEKDVVHNFLSFKWASCSSASSIWSYSHWPILEEFCTEESDRVLQKETTKQRMVKSPPFTWQRLLS